MAKRLCVILKDADYREVQRMASARHLSIAEWVRQTLKLARRRQFVGSPSTKLKAIRAASGHSYPVGGIDGMLAEIEKEYGAGAQP